MRLHSKNWESETSSWPGRWPRLEGVGLAIIALAICVSPNASAQTQTDLTLRAVAGAKRADAELAQIYRQFKKTQPLILAERAWIAYRDAECRYEHHATPEGSMYGMENAMCIEAMTRDRIKVLKQNLDEQYEGY